MVVILYSSRSVMTVYKNMLCKDYRDLIYNPKDKVESKDQRLNGEESDHL